jgi:hypothetical protein
MSPHGDIINVARQLEELMAAFSSDLLARFA